MQVAEGIDRFEDQGVVNWYLVETDEGPIAIDAGFPTAWRQVRDRAHELRAIVVTHAHIDHLGFTEKARKEAGVPVYLPVGDAELARHVWRYAKSERNPAVYAARYAPTRRLYFRALKAGAVYGKTVSEFRTYAEGETLPGGLRPIATPGHTDGHMALHLADRDVLFAGDAFVTRDPYTDRTGPRIVARAATRDSGRAKASLDAIAATGATTVLTGHGDPWTQGAAAAAEHARAASVA